MAIYRLALIKLIKLTFVDDSINDESDVKLLIIAFEANQMARKHF